ncbi:hypothetical protein [Streptomyces sp. NBC_00316]|uniref:hypothetical protein n=1 Tax=Streptomyces sp. NBC_00316 TaxID=2975710 RepID=UPI003FA70CE9
MLPTIRSEAVQESRDFDGLLGSDEVMNPPGAGHRRDTCQDERPVAHWCSRYSAPVHTGVDGP